jgi:hypothetical protein
LCRQGLVRSQDNRRTLRFLDDIGNRVGLAGTGDAEQSLPGQSIIQSLDQAGYGLLLIARRIEFRDQGQAVTIIR